MAAATEKGTDRLNSLLRGELSAVETYQQALDKFAKDPAAADLRRLQAEHREAVTFLQQHVRQHGGKPDESSGAWGTFVKAVEGAAKLFGNKAALKALKEGEEQGISDYEKALGDENLQADCKEVIRSRLLPQTRAHIPVVDRLTEAK